MSGFSCFQAQMCLHTCFYCARINSSNVLNNETSYMSLIINMGSHYSILENLLSAKCVVLLYPLH